LSSTLSLLALAAFAVFLGLGAYVAFRPTTTAKRAFIGWTLLLTLASGATQIDVWPFTSYTLAAFRPRAHTVLCSAQFFGVTEDMREWPVDPLAWSPHYHSIVQLWIDTRFEQLPPDRRREALRYLLQRAEMARERLASGRRIGFERRLGPFNDRYWWLLRRPARTSTEPFVALRIYRSCVDPNDELERDIKPVRTLIAEEKR
jgi:hypothetical protein